MRIKSVIWAAIVVAGAATSACGPSIDLKAELNFDDALTDAPIFVVMHGFSPATGNFTNVRAGAQRLRGDPARGDRDAPIRRTRSARPDRANAPGGCACGRRS